MNEKRRKLINGLVEKTRNLSLEVEKLKDEEQEYYDNMPEGLQNGEKGTAAYNAIESLNEAIGQLDEAADHLESAAE